VRISDRVHLLPGLASIGVIEAGRGEAVLIDTGLGDRDGRRILRVLGQAGLKPAAILNTHSHGDHCGGNALLVERSGARIYAPPLEADVIENPAWGTASVFGGAEPLPEFAVPRYAPRPSPVYQVIEPGTHHVAGVEIEMVPLRGHTPAHSGYLVDDVLFLGDAVAGKHELETAPLSYAYSIGQQIETLARLAESDHTGYILGHGGHSPDIRPLIREGHRRIQRALDLVAARLADGPAQTHQITAALSAGLGIELHHARGYYLLTATVHAYLSYLAQQGRIRPRVSHSELRWEATAPSA
jgi:glyoxylase-like metal-dependent hydrolase (beta-lactamase superfamily II)